MLLIPCMWATRTSPGSTKTSTSFPSPKPFILCISTGSSLASSYLREYLPFFTLTVATSISWPFSLVRTRATFFIFLPSATVQSAKSPLITHVPCALTAMQATAATIVDNNLFNIVPSIYFSAPSTMLLSFFTISSPLRPNSTTLPLGSMSTVWGTPFTLSSLTPSLPQPLSVEI